MFFQDDDFQFYTKLLSLSCELSPEKLSPVMGA